MSKPTAYIDVDLTLVDLDLNLLPHVPEQLERLSYKYTLVCWSAGGKDYAESVLKKHRLSHYFDYVLSKPFIVIDDAPDHLLSHARVVKIAARTDWANLWDSIFNKDVSSFEARDQVTEIKAYVARNLSKNIGIR